MQNPEGLAIFGVLIILMGIAMLIFASRRRWFIAFLSLFVPKDELQEAKASITEDNNFVKGMRFIGWIEIFIGITSFITGMILAW